MTTLSGIPTEGEWSQIATVIKENFTKLQTELTTQQNEIAVLRQKVENLEQQVLTLSNR